MEEFIEELKDLAYGMGTRDSTCLSSACYLGSRIFDIEMPGDFSPRGKAYVVSSTIKKGVYILNQRIELGTVSPIPVKDKNSKLRRLGSILRDYEEEDIFLASLYLIYNNKKWFSKSEKEKAEEIIDKIKKGGKELSLLTN